MAELAALAGFAAVVAGICVVVRAVLGAVGFGPAGVVGGSAAAWVQSTFLGGFIARGGAFATLQSWGAAGIPSAGMLTTAAVLAAAAHLM